jgi:hypothetical protein
LKAVCRVFFDNTGKGKESDCESNCL